MSVRDLSFNFGTTVTTPRYHLVSSAGVVGAAVSPGTAVNAATGSYFVSQVDIGASRAVLWTCDTPLLDTLVQFYGENDSPIDGAYVITVTVTDGTDPLEAAVVRVTNGANSFTGSTDASGNASFSLDALTYTVSVTKSGYSFAPTTRTVTGTQAGTLVNDLEMSVTVVPPVPEDPLKGTIYGSVKTSDASTKAGYAASAGLLGVNGYEGPFRIGSLLIPKNHTTTTDSDGQWTLALYANADITPAGSQWRVTVDGTRLVKLVTVVAGVSTDTDPA